MNEIDWRKGTDEDHEHLWIIARWEHVLDGSQQMLRVELAATGGRNPRSRLTVALNPIQYGWIMRSEINQRFVSTKDALLRTRYEGKELFVEIR